MHRLSRWAVLLTTSAALTASIGCTRGKSKSQQADAGSGTTTTAAAPSGAGPDAEWLAGTLPASMNEGEPVSGGEVVVQMYTDPPSLNNIVDSDWWAARVTEHHVYQALIGVDPYDDPDYQLVPELAERWDVSDDKLTFTFYLRKGVKWHDGEAFDAEDVIATFDKIQDETTKAVHVRAYTQELESYEAIDDFTVRFKWKRPYFLALDTPFADVPIQPAHIIGKLTGVQYNEAASNPINRAPVGTGPWKFVEWVTDEKMVFERWDGYWGRKTYLDRLVFRIVKDPTMGVQLAEKGQLDVVTSVLAEDWVKMGERPALVKNFNRSLFHDANYSWIGWNQKRPLFADAKVRNALTLLIDRPGFIKSVLHGQPMPTACHFYFKSKACDPSLKPPPYDPVKAVKLLEEAGWKDTDGDGFRDKDGMKFSFTVMLPASTVTGERLATMMKEELKRAGLEVGIQKVEWAAFTKRLREHQFDACMLAWGGGPRGEPTQIWHSSSVEGGSNYVLFENPKVDALIEKARVEFDEDARNAMYREFGRILHAEQPYTWLWINPRRALLHKRIKGAKESLMFWQFEDWWIDPAYQAAR